MQRDIKKYINLSALILLTRFSSISSNKVANFVSIQPLSQVMKRGVILKI